MDQSPLVATEIPLKEIFSDADFNCRGRIIPHDVIDLARSIDAHGLQQPIAVQPYDQKSPFKYRIVMGHRRFEAYKVLASDDQRYKNIPAFVRHGLTDVEARILNLTENLKRHDLNMLQEAKAIEHLKNAGLGQDDVAQAIGASRGWVQIRFNVLDLPPEIQKEVALGLLNQEQVRELHTLPRDEQFEAVKQIKGARERGDKPVKIRKGKKKNPFKKKERDHSEIQEMMAHMREHIGNGLYTRTLAWASGEISDLELYRDIKDEAEERGIPYEIPSEVLAAV